MLQPKQLSRVYYVCKELLMTERTYKKDLDIINIVSSCIECIEFLFGSQWR